MSHAPDCPNFHTHFPWNCNCDQHFECEDCPMAEPRWCEKVGYCKHRDRPGDGADGYRQAFYEIADMLGLSARPTSPKDVWETEMRPKLAAAVEIVRQVASMEGRTDAQTYWFGRARDLHLAQVDQSPSGSRPERA